MKLIQWAFIFFIVVILIGNEVEAAVRPQDFGLKVGITAPDFSAVTDAGSKVTLSYLYKKGPIVLIFYSGEWCPVCDLYLQTLQRHLMDFKKFGVKILAVSGDKPEYSRKLVEEDGLGFDVISDPQENILKAYNVQYVVPPAWAKEYAKRYHIDNSDNTGHGPFAIAVPAEYVIDITGTIIYAKTDFQVRAKPEEILDLVRKLH